MDTEIEEVKQEVRKVEQEIRKVEQEIRKVEQEIRKVEQEIRKVEQEIRKVEQEIRKVEQEIIKVEQEIRKVEQQIVDVEGKLTEAVGDADVAYWRKEKEQLRKEKEQLRKKEEQLRQEKDRLRQEKDRLGQEKDRLRKKEEQLREKELVPIETSTPEMLMTMETIKKLVEGLNTRVDQIAAKSEVKSVAMSSVGTNLALDIMNYACINLIDGSFEEPAREVSVPERWKFDMAGYASEKDCYEPFFQLMVDYLCIEHGVEIQKDPPFTREPGCCRLLDVHSKSHTLMIEAELGDRTLKIAGNLDAAIISPRRSELQYAGFSLGGVEVKHSTAHKEKYKHGAPTVGAANSGRPWRDVPGQALVEALAVYAHSQFPIGIFLLTSFDENFVMRLKDREFVCWVGLNFAQAMDKVAAFLNSDDVKQLLGEELKPINDRKRPEVSEDKTALKKRLKVGVGNEEFLEQVDAIRLSAGSKVEMVGDLFQLMDSWRYSMTKPCGSGGSLSYFS